ncbi:MAG: hypothetical protein DMD90_12375 [Candidatus Rokuibacteriota bacterium]|nr:MAG: hypothetical protein DMD90_12375 [Candidatus Rokubacteria bacterium]
MFTRLQGQTWVGFTVMDKHTLGPKIRQGIRDGLLPTQRPSRTWFGFAQGDTSCAACGQPVAIRELECEAEFPGEPRTYLFHAACFEAWQTERVTGLVCAVCGHPNDGAPGATVSGDRVHATCAAGSNGDGAAAGAPTSRLSVPRARPDDGVSGASWPVRFLRDVSGTIRRSAGEVIRCIASGRRVRPR